MDDVIATGLAEWPAAAPSATPHHVFLIDGSGFIFRAYFARARDPKAERFQRKSDGMATEVVMIFSNMLDKYLRDADADHIAVIFDASGRSFRNEIYGEYKANRREMPDDLAPQLEHVRRAADAFGVCRIEMENFEADDLIATYARHAVEAGANVTILSSDKDMMQLVADGRVMMRDPMTDRPIGEAEVREKFGVGPDKVIEVQALCGDSTDNVPGVPGIGVKTAAELINAYGDLEALLEHAHEIKQPKRREALIDNEAKARLSKELVKLDDDVPLPCPLSALHVKPYDPDKLFPFLDEMELRALKSRIEKRLAIAAPPLPAGPSEPVTPEVLPFSAERTYAVVDTLDGLDHWIERAVQAGAVALWPMPSAVAGTRPELCGIAMAVAPGVAAYVPLGHRSPGGAPGLLDAPPAGLSREAALVRLKPLFEDPGVLKVGHDIKGAAHLLRRYGIALRPCDCTMLMSYVLDGGQVAHDIEELVRRTFSHELTPLKELVGTGKSLICFAEVATAAARDFVAER
ncbi:MAG TPA: 5'-3' exonuclease H3TH domain-containing protein, partial [Stellaceae bacterium]|nr:5'-3' exonuclease H3TH domain-containing protein [Stellaceae bacterium]